jgi:hypothetical protein
VPPIPFGKKWTPTGIDLKKPFELEVEGTAGLPAGIAARHRFRNDRWEVDLLVEQNGTSLSDKSTVKDLRPEGKERSGGLFFRLKQGSNVSVFPPDAEALPYRASGPFGRKWYPERFDLKKPFELDVEEAPELPPGVYAGHRFRNNLWEIDLFLAQKGRQKMISEKSTIRNLHPAKRAVPLSASPASGGLHFRLTQENKVYPFRVDGEPLPYDSKSEFRKNFEVDSIDFRRPFDLQQEFEYANSPVKQIIALELFRNCHRLANVPLQSSLSIKPSKPDDIGDPKAAKPAAAPAAGAAGAPEAGTTPHGLPRMRYIFRTPQCRHVPFVLHLLVDQTHMHEVLMAMANSRLRIQTTQVQFRHSGSGQGVAEAPAGPSLGGARFGGGPAAATPTAAAEEDPNLLEMVVYGVASLYERFPPKTAPQPGQGEAPKPPAGGPAAPTAKGPEPGKAAPPPAAAPPAKAPEPPKPADAAKAAAPPAKPPEGAKPPEKTQGEGPKKP